MQPLTYGEAYQKGSSLLQVSGYHQSEARIAARLVLEKVTGVRYAHLLHPDVLLQQQHAEDYWELIEDVGEGVPLAYATGEGEFYGLQFVCDYRALIPRPETETLVEAAIKRLKRHPAPLVTDLGTGSGCIALAMAHELPQCVIYATDASKHSLMLARKNAEHLGIHGRIEFVEGTTGEWAQPLIAEGFAGKFDAVLTNPPYISTQEIETLQPQIRDYEPHIALDGGEDGLACYRQIAVQCGVLIAPNGFLMAELGAGQFAEVRSIFESHGWQVEPPLLDLARIERVLVAIRP